MEDGRILAVFDFDNTLIAGDSFLQFLAAVAGAAPALWSLARAAALCGIRLLLRDPAAGDYRTFIKERLVGDLLAGRATTEIAPAIEKIKSWMTWNEPVRKALFDHRAKGHCIVIISGALDLYLHDLLGELPCDALICTRIGIEDGVIQRGLPDGNCVRKRKAELLASWIAEHGPFADSWGYGNLPHDLPMLELLQKRIVI